MLLLDLGFEAALFTILGTVTEEGALLAINYVMASVTDADAHGTDSSVASQAARVAVVPVLFLELLARANECALLLRLEHVFKVTVTIVKLLPTEALQQSLLLLLLSLLLSIFLARREHGVRLMF